MTPGSHLSATQGGGGGASKLPTVCWAARRKWAEASGLQRRSGPEGREREGGKKLFFIFKRAHKIEFKHKFESKHIKTMQQHVCNNKLL
jgi:hypothetical protein